MNKSYARIPSLMDESPISFYPYLAKVLGVNEAIVLQQIWFWINSNRNKKSTYHFREGKWWVYNSYKQWCEDEFIWLKPRGLQGIVLNLESKGILLSMQGVPNKHDRRKWYSIDLKVLEDLLETHLGHSAENVPYSAENVLSIDDSMHDVDVHEMHDEYTEIEKTTEKTPEKKETTFAPAFADRDEAHSHNHQDASQVSGDWPEGIEVSYPDFKKPAQAEKRPTPAQTPSPSLKPKAGAKSIEEQQPLPQSSAAAPSPAVSAPVLEGNEEKALEVAATLEGKKPAQRTPKQSARDESLKIAMNALAAAMAVTLTKPDEKRYSQIAQTMVTATIPYSEFDTYVKRLKAKAKTEGDWTVSVESLIKNGRMSEYVTARDEYRKKQAANGLQAPWTGVAASSSVSYHQPSETALKSRPVVSQEERIAALEEIKREQIS